VRGKRGGAPEVAECPERDRADDGAGRRGDESEEGAEERRLARSVPSQETNDLSGVEKEIDVREDHSPAEPL
jgi:hypothetical protein